MSDTTIATPIATMLRDVLLNNSDVRALVDSSERIQKLQHAKSTVLLSKTALSPAQVKTAVEKYRVLRGQIDLDMKSALDHIASPDFIRGILAELGDKGVNISEEVANLLVEDYRATTDVILSAASDGSSSQVLQSVFESVAHGLAKHALPILLGSGHPLLGIINILPPGALQSIVSTAVTKALSWFSGAPRSQRATPSASESASFHDLDSALALLDMNGSVSQQSEEASA